MGWKVDSNILKKTAASLMSEFGQLNDLPDEVANTTANVYYRLHAYHEHLAGGDVYLLAPFLGKSKNWIESYSNFNKFSAELTSDIKVMPGLIKAIRDAHETQSKSYDYMVGIFLDAFKYRIANALNKSRPRRWLERQLKTPFEVDDLLDSIRSSEYFKEEPLKNTPLINGTEISDLHWCAASGDAEKTKKLIFEGAAINVRMSLLDEGIQLCNGATPLHLACANGADAVVKVLLDAGADPTITTETGDTPLHWAVDVSDELVLELLQSGAAHMAKMKGGEIALHWACCPIQTLRWGSNDYGPITGCLKNNPKKTIATLLEKGSPINEPDNYGWTPLHWRTQFFGDPEQLVGELLRYGADMARVNKKGQTPLVQAILSINPNIVEELLDNQASLPDDYDRQALVNDLSKARKSPSRDRLIKILIDFGILSANQEGVDNLIEVVGKDTGFSSFDRENLLVLDAAANKKIIRMLLSNGAGVDSFNADGVTPLMVAAGTGNSALKRGRAFTDIFYRTV